MAIPDTVVKSHYSKGGPGKTLRAAKVHVRYAVHRCNERGQRQYRDVWDRDGRIDKQTAYERLDASRPNDHVFRLVISPHPERHDADRRLDLQAWTRDVMRQWESETAKPIEWFAVAHQDPEHRHVHVVAITRGRLDPEHLRSMKEAGDISALAQQREHAQEAALERHAARGWGMELSA